MMNIHAPYKPIENQQGQPAKGDRNMNLISKEQMDVISAKHLEAKKDFKNRCFFLIEALVSGDIIYANIEKIEEDICKIAHIGTGTCENPHEDWVEEVEAMFVKFENNGLL
ncbi:MAG: hypothetical protein ABIJ40_00465 [Bacteroidota bacterium]